MFNSVTASTGIAWNGPICGTCGKRYIDIHSCSWEDVQRRIDELRAVQDRLPRPRVLTPEFERNPNP